jgi:twitching motility protein PilT
MAAAIPQTIEHLLRETVRVGGRELRLVPGHRAAVSGPAGEQELAGAPQSSDTIQQLMAPVVTPQARQALLSGRAEWNVRHSDLGGIRIIFEVKEGVSAARLTFDEVIDASRKAKPTPVTVVPPVSPRAEIDELFLVMHRMNASDLHISVGSPPLLRHDGQIKPVEGKGILTAEDTARLLLPIAPKKNLEEFEKRHDTDFAYEIKGVARFRANLFMDRKGMGGVFRLIPSKIISAEDMALSKEILQLCHLPKGLVLVTGPTGSGKSTTLCALIDYVNRTRSDHVITIEDPIEFVHENKKCLINQRQIGDHTDSFKDALRAALREDPDIVLVGEMRDLETVSIAIETAETGHLVFGTLHTSSAASTVDRIIDQFPADRQDQIRVMLAESLKGVISQVLCRKIGGGRVAALEVLIGLPSVSNLIREAKIFQIPSIMQTARKHGMVTMNDALTDLVKRNLVEPQEAYAKAVDKAGLLGSFRRGGMDVSWAPSDASAPTV